MKALSLKQPYAELILQGRKIIELRKWNTSFRGICYIHASKNVDAEAMKRFGFTELPTGSILGTMVIADVKKYNSVEEHEADKQKHLASTVWGNYGFILKQPVRLTPIHCKGKRNFWEYTGDLK